MSCTRDRKPSRERWLQKALANRIADAEVAQEYARVINVGIKVRNKIAHVPLFDRSAHLEWPAGQTQVYDVDRAVKEYGHDSAALLSLLTSLHGVARYLLLDRAFGTKHFVRPRPLKTMRITSGQE